MKKYYLNILLYIIALNNIHAQIVKDPLLEYYVTLKSIQSSAFSPVQVSPETNIHLFKADFTGDGHKSIFITSDVDALGKHGDCSWTVYFPTKKGLFQILKGGVDAWTTGPDYIGYIPEIKKYGAIVCFRIVVNAQYVDTGAIQSQVIEENRVNIDSVHYPKYVHHTDDSKPDYHITTYTFAQLAQKYPNPVPDNVVAPVGK